MLHVHRGARADDLVGALADVLAPPPADPMEPDVVAVHSNGIQRWLSQMLATRLGVAGPSRQDGICANVQFVFPSAIVGQALAAAAGLEPDDPDPWAPQALAWQLLELLVDPPPGFDPGPLRGHLDDPAARFGAVRRVAALFDRYATHRPDMLLAWADGVDVDAAGAALAPGHGWQPRVWRELRGRVDVPSRPERLELAVAQLDAGTLELSLSANRPVPARLSLFGLTALPARDVRLLQAIGRHRDVHVFLLHPSPALWDRLVPAVSVQRELPRREHDVTTGQVAHPLLASWGRDVRETQLVLAIAGVSSTTLHGPVGAPAPTTLLGRIQADLVADRRPPGAPIGGRPDRRALLQPDDRSVQVHGCHGRTRQVEVLRDAIGHLLKADRQLEPRDIVVLCPDVEEFAPLIHAVFGAEAVEPGHDDRGLPQLRVRLADRALRKANPLFEVVSSVLELADSRVEASRVLDLATRVPVRRRFQFDDDDLTQLETWVGKVGIRWGLDADHRADFGLDGIEANTWRAGLDRLLVGVAVADDALRSVGDVVPFDVEGEDVERVGLVAELLARLRRAAALLRHPQPIAGWAATIRAVVDLLTEVPERDAWQRQQLDRVLDEVVRDAGGREGAGPSTVPITLGEARGLLADRLRGRPSWANHRTGNLTVCTLYPMRAVPHRVVCLLGMDDRAFPRRTVPDGDDLVAAEPWVGDHDPRTEDRQLLLDALLATSDALVVTYTARDERTNEPRPPAVPIGELLDTIDATVTPQPAAVSPSGGHTLSAAPRQARDVVVVEHPLQPFDPRNFSADHLGVPGPWSFQRTDLDGARALTAPRSARGPFVATPLPPLLEPLVALDDLTTFLDQPVQTFLLRRLGVRVPRDADQPDDAIPIQASGLTRYAVGTRLLEAVRSGWDRERWEAVERARGDLPPGRLADPELEDAAATVDALLGVVADTCGSDALAAGPTRRIELDLEVGAGGRRLVGTVDGVHDDQLVVLRYARMKPKYQLAAYARLAALTLADPQRPWSALVAGRNKARAKKRIAWCRLGPLGDTPDQRAENAREAIALLLDLYDRGLCEPLPMYSETSAAYAECMQRQRPDRFGAADVWNREFGRSEHQEPAHVLVYGPGSTFESLLEEPPTDAERGPGWPDVQSRFEALALRVWLPVFACREQGVA